MKPLLTFTISLLLFCSVAYSQQQAALIGTWKLMSGKYTYNDSTVNYEQANLNSIKIITPTHFAVFSQGVNNTFEHAFAGKAKFDGKNYTESIQYGSSTSVLGTDMIFTYELNGDKWHIKGGGNGYIFDENWERVK
jgi:hypothetical protein